MHAVPNGWAKQATMLIFDFKSEPFRAALELFNCMEAAEFIHEGDGAPSKTKTPREDANQSIGRKTQGVEYKSPTGSDKNFPHKLKNKYVHC